MRKHPTQDEIDAALDAAFAASKRGNARGNGQSSDAGRERKQADTLLELASAVELWHAPDGAAYVDILHDGHRETWPLRSRGSRRWLLRRYYEQTQSAPSAQAMQDALGRAVIVSARLKHAERVLHRLRAGRALGLLVVAPQEQAAGATRAQRPCLAMPVMQDVDIRGAVRRMPKLNRRCKL